MKPSKRFKNNLKKVKEKEIKSIDEAIEALQNLEKTKFTETVEVHLKLNTDPTKSDQQIRTSVELPFGTGKVPKIAVFAEGDQAQAAKDAKADLILGEKDIANIQKNGKIDFDIALATPEMMPKIARIAKILGPKGLMPNPKTETVTADVKEAINKLKKGKANVKNEKGGCIHQAIGKITFKKEELKENYQTLIEAIEKQKPVKLKGKLIKNITITTTMGPAIKLV